jgi:hypothetical protein
LTGDGLGLGLLVRRDPGVNRHLRWIHDATLLSTCCGGWVHSVCLGGSPGDVVRRGMGTTRS